MPGALSHNGLLGGRISGKALEIGVCITAASGFLLFGYDQGMFSGILSTAPHSTNTLISARHNERHHHRTYLPRNFPSNGSGQQIWCYSGFGSCDIRSWLPIRIASHCRDRRPARTSTISTHWHSHHAGRYCNPGLSNDSRTDDSWPHCDRLGKWHEHIFDPGLAK